MVVSTKDPLSCQRQERLQHRGHARLYTHDLLRNNSKIITESIPMTTHSHHTFTRSPLRLSFCSLFLVAAVVAAIAAVASPRLAAKARWATPTADAPGAPDVVRLVGPVVSDTKVRDLPYIPPTP